MRLTDVHDIGRKHMRCVSPTNIILNINFKCQILLLLLFFSGSSCYNEQSFSYCLGSMYDNEYSAALKTPANILCITLNTHKKTVAEDKEVHWGDHTSDNALQFNISWP